MTLLSHCAQAVIQVGGGQRPPSVEYLVEFVAAGLPTGKGDRWQKAGGISTSSSPVKIPAPVPWPFYRDRAQS
jgi:hypothetical protein